MFYDVPAFIEINDIYRHKDSAYYLANVRESNRRVFTGVRVGEIYPFERGRLVTKLQRMLLHCKWDREKMHSELVKAGILESGESIYEVDDTTRREIEIWLEWKAPDIFEPKTKPKPVESTFVRLIFAPEKTVPVAKSKPSRVYGSPFKKAEPPVEKDPWIPFDAFPDNDGVMWAECRRDRVLAGSTMPGFKIYHPDALKRPSSIIVTENGVLVHYCPNCGTGCIDTRLKQSPHPENEQQTENQ